MDGEPSVLFERSDFVRIICAALKSLGLHRSSESVESESGISLYSEAARKLRDYILCGEWPDVMRILEEIATPSSAARAKFIIQKQQCLELMSQDSVMNVTDSGRVDDTLNIIRSMTELKVNFEEVLELLMHWCYRRPFDVPDRAGLLPQLEGILHCGVFLEKRLVQLVEQAVTLQKRSCKYHNLISQKTSLFRDHACGEDQLPRKNRQNVGAHIEPIWHLRFSTGGNLLASSSPSLVVVWEVDQGRISPKLLLAGPGEINHICFDPSGIELVICADEGVERRCMDTGEILRSFSKNGVRMVSCAWLIKEDGSSVIITGNDDQTISEWTMDGVESRNWEVDGIEKVNMAISSNNEIVFVSGPNRITLLNISTSATKQICETSDLKAVTVSSDHKYIVAGLYNNIISIWSIDGVPKQMKMICDSDLVGLNSYVCFGGVEDSFVAASNNDHRVRIWNKFTGDLVCTLEGHAAAVDAMCWNPVDPTMLVTGGRDGRILVWGHEAEMVEYDLGVETGEDTRVGQQAEEHDLGGANRGGLG